MLRAILRKIGLPVHKGWRKVDRHGCEIKCAGCGERRSLYCLTGHYTHRDPHWWETTASGDGSCGEIRELPARIY